MRNKYVVWMWPLIWMGIIYWFSAQSQLPTPIEPWLNVLIKKGAHLGEYAVLFSLWVRALMTVKLGWNQRYIMALIMTGLFALSDEYHQSWVVGRQARVTDVLIDLVGAMMALVVWKKRLQDKVDSKLGCQ